MVRPGNGDAAPAPPLPFVDAVRRRGAARTCVAYLGAVPPCVRARSLVLARYTELMNGVVDAAEDVRILRRAGVVVNQLKSDKEAADMWNGMCRAARLSRVDGVIREVNAYRSRRAVARVRRMINKYVFRSWRVLTLLAALVLLLMTAMQTFCLVYPCQRWFGNLIPLPTPGGPSLVVD
ncbi:hypothetical protein PR202_gb28706 [Eleusine coracana subsp. coracana]|uniref:Uncharacterized protein n=1 Tax=Eleusine coracana subsp. coracana TaxID=191504 RepID=A0AAV5FYN3_ELECO|nr:hypothetical protein PR202_gb28706 [Eleusine coracana subsp. coracana]